MYRHHHSDLAVRSKTTGCAQALRMHDDLAQKSQIHQVVPSSDCAFDTDRNTGLQFVMPGTELHVACKSRPEWKRKAPGHQPSPSRSISTPTAQSPEMLTATIAATSPVTLIRRSGPGDRGSPSLPSHAITLGLSRPAASFAEPPSSSTTGIARKTDFRSARPENLTRKSAQGIFRTIAKRNGSGSEIITACG